MCVKGIVLAGGTGSRLQPLTAVFSKQLLPVFDKPLIHYPISTLMAAGIREILIITTPQDQHLFKNLLGDGSEIGVSFEFRSQEKPAGIPQAFLIGEDFVGEDKVALILGDNIFFGSGLGRQLATYMETSGALVFGYSVSDPERYGVAEIDASGNVLSLVEKPTMPRSNIAVTGLYFYDNSVISRTKSLGPSARGELEITDLNQSYLESGELRLNLLPRGTAWLDTGTFGALHDASTFVRVIEERQATKIACLEEIAWRNDWVTSEDLEKLALTSSRKNISKYLISLIN
jgi:glucose-1-phosphate thymidylyltransferase